MMITWQEFVCPLVCLPSTGYRKISLDCGSILLTIFLLNNTDRFSLNEHDFHRIPLLTLNSIFDNFFPCMFPNNETRFQKYSGNLMGYYLEVVRYYWLSLNMSTTMKAWWCHFLNTEFFHYWNWFYLMKTCLCLEIWLSTEYKIKFLKVNQIINNFITLSQRLGNLGDK